MPVLEGLRIAAEVVTNMPMQAAVQEAAARIREGAPIGKSLAAGGYFPPICIHLISSGEASGELETMLARAAANQEKEMDGLIAALMGLMEPALIVDHGRHRADDRAGNPAADFPAQPADQLRPRPAGTPRGCISSGVRDRRLRRRSRRAKQAIAKLCKIRLYKRRIVGILDSLWHASLPLRESRPLPAVAPAPAPEPDAVDEQDVDAVPSAATTDNVGDISVEVNVEDLIAQIESESKGNAMADGLARRKIEDILEEKRIAREIMDLDDFDIDD